MPSLMRWAPGPVKSAVNKTIWKYRQATWSARIYPGFIIIGAQKSGTSSLFHYLSQHPQLVPSYDKEVHFFDGGFDPDIDTFSRGAAWYRSHFPLKRDINADQKAFEASPEYIFNPLVPQRIFDLLPEVRLIAVLRNPVERAISHYFHSKRAGYESLPMMEAFLAEEGRLESVTDVRGYRHNTFIYNSYKSRGLYHEQLARYLDYFPAGHLLVINSESLFTQPIATLRRVFGFVHVESDFVIQDLQRRNVGRNRTDVAPEVQEYLKGYFLTHNQRLYELTGEDYGW